MNKGETMEFITDPENQDLMEFAIRSGATYDTTTGYFYTEGIDLVRFANLVRAQTEDRMEQDAESRYEEFAEYEPSEATEWADYDPDC